LHRQGCGLLAKPLGFRHICDEGGGHRRHGERLADRLGVPSGASDLDAAFRHLRHLVEPNSVEGVHRKLDQERDAVGGPLFGYRGEGSAKSLPCGFVPPEQVLQTRAGNGQAGPIRIVRRLECLHGGCMRLAQLTQRHKRGRQQGQQGDPLGTRFRR
jgi:hypothetical protein